MRYHDLFDARAWKKYEGRDRRCVLASLAGVQGTVQQFEEVSVMLSTVRTGRQKVFAGYAAMAVLPTGDEIIAEDPHVLRRALRGLEGKLNALGWSLEVAGLDSRWGETGLSSNTGYGFHPEMDGVVHMLDPAIRSI